MTKEFSKGVKFQLCWTKGLKSYHSYADQEGDAAAQTSKPLVFSLTVTQELRVLVDLYGEQVLEDFIPMPSSMTRSFLSHV